jgi:uridine kinase
MALMAQSSKFVEIIEAIAKLQNNYAQSVVCIDGPAGSGKTTLAGIISSKFESVNVVHMDDLYDGWVTPLNSELYSRITSQIIEPHLKKEPAVYDVFNWWKHAFDHKDHLEIQKTLVIEGVGAAGSEVRKFADLTVFVEVSAELGLERVLSRDGLGIVNEMQSWQEMESAHFNLDQTKKVADFVVDGSLELDY